MTSACVCKLMTVSQAVGVCFISSPLLEVEGLGDDRAKPTVFMALRGTETSLNSFSSTLLSFCHVIMLCVTVRTLCVTAHAHKQTRLFSFEAFRLDTLTWCQGSNMDSFHKPSALSFDGNNSENWRRFKQQYDIYLTASGSEKKDDTVKIAILLNFAGEDAIEVFNTFQFPKGDEKKLNKVLEQFERYCNPRKNVVFERYQFWQITQKDSETVDQFVTRLKNKVKSCEYTAVDDMVRDKFVFSKRDLSVKERLLREDKLTLEKAISMARASEASKEQVKAMGTKEQNDENPSVNEIRAGGTTGGDKQKQNPSRRPRPGAGSKKVKCTLVVLLTRGDLAQLSEKRVIIARKKVISRVFAERECGTLAGKLCTPWLNRRAVIMKPICLHFQWSQAVNTLLKMIGTSRLR